MHCRHLMHQRSIFDGSARILVVRHRHFKWRIWEISIFTHFSIQFKWAKWAEFTHFHPFLPSLGGYRDEGRCVQSSNVELAHFSEGTYIY